MSFQPVRLQDLASTQITGLVYGATGVGKTVFSCGSQRMRTLHLDIDVGNLSANCWPGDPAQGIPATRRDLVWSQTCATFADVMAAHQHLLANRRAYDLVVLDTMTELQRIVLGELCRRQSVEVPDQRLWGIALTMMDEITRSFKSLGVHLLGVAHEKVIDDEAERRSVFAPAFQGQFLTYYARHFSLIMRYAMAPRDVRDPATGQVSREHIRALQGRYNGTCHAKDRSHALSAWERPFIDAVFDKIIARITSSTQQGDPIRESSTTQAGERPATAAPGSSSSGNGHPAAASAVPAGPAAGAGVHRPRPRGSAGARA